MSRYAKRTDANHAEIRDYLRSKLGKDKVKDCSRFGEGFPDLVIAYGALLMGIEIKTETGGLSEAQQKCTLPFRLVRNKADADESINVLMLWHKAINKDAI